jgi:phosphate transport system permease protein
MKAQEGLREGDICIWLSGAAAALALALAAGLFLLIAFNGLRSFWPSAVTEATLRDGSVQVGMITEKEAVPVHDGVVGGMRIQLKQGNRDLYGQDFRWLNEADIVSRRIPKDVLVIERLEWGMFIGWPEELRNGTEVLASGAQATLGLLQQAIAESENVRAHIRYLKQDVVGALARQEEHIRIALSGGKMPEADVEQKLKDVQEKLSTVDEQLSQLRAGDSKQLMLRTADGQHVSVPVSNIVRAFAPNQMGWFSRAGLYLQRIWEFVSADPRESNTEGGVFPAIFGTIMTVFLMSIFVTPVGVMAAVYLREYAKQGTLVSLIRIAVNNLAGVPSIVFGVFGVGFFVYFLGGNIDRLFFSDSLPNPTFGTGGILWASLTLALLTIPTVIVATEEGLAAIPRHLREGSYALGATKFETLFRVILPSLLPSILTGMILAVARAAGEVAPLMITGVVKLAPSLPIDGQWPFLHLDRKFMHLGFHIYDVGFQSPNVEAARPMVYATALLLLLIVIALNLGAMVLRNKLRARFRGHAV